MASLSALQEAVHFYESNYRRSDVGHFQISGVYDLFPDDPVNPSVQVTASWPSEWPHAGNPGVYIMFDSGLNILYVGKASFRHVLGNRLSSYFAYERDGSKRCKVLDEWSFPPRFIVTIPVLPERTFEASALEEFLIMKLQPPDNRVGRKPKPAT